MSKSKTTSTAKRGCERLTLWSLQGGEPSSEVFWRSRTDAEAVADLWKDARVVRVTVTVDPPRRRAGKDKR